MRFQNIAALDNLIGWKPRAWKKNGGRMYNGNGHRKPKGPRHTPSPASIRRKHRSLAGRKR